MTFNLIKNLLAQPDDISSKPYTLLEKDYDQLLFNWARVNLKKAKYLTTIDHCLNCLSFTGPFNKPQATCLISVADNPQVETLQIEWGCSATPFGDAFIANSPRGLIALHFLDTEFQIEDALKLLIEQWPKASIFSNPNAIDRLCRQLFSPANNNSTNSVYVYVHANPFQVRVWQTLSNISAGRLISYGQLANLCGQPGAARAVGSALAANQIGWVIPCHRVIQANGDFGHFRWGTYRKQAMHVWEMGHTIRPAKKVALQ